MTDPAHIQTCSLLTGYVGRGVNTSYPSIFQWQKAPGLNNPFSCNLFKNHPERRQSWSWRQLKTCQRIAVCLCAGRYQHNLKKKKKKITKMRGEGEEPFDQKLTLSQWLQAKHRLRLKLSEGQVFNDPVTEACEMNWLIQMQRSYEVLFKNYRQLCFTWFLRLAHA